MKNAEQQTIRYDTIRYDTITEQKCFFNYDEYDTITFTTSTTSLLVCKRRFEYRYFAPIFLLDAHVVLLVLIYPKKSLLLAARKTSDG